MGSLAGVAEVSPCRLFNSDTDERNRCNEPPPDPPYLAGAVCLFSGDIRLRRGSDEGFAGDRQKESRGEKGGADRRPRKGRMEIGSPGRRQAAAAERASKRDLRRGT